MANLVYRMVLVILLLGCLTSFGWGMRRFFIRPERIAPGMRITSILAPAFTFVHLGVLATAYDLTLARSVMGALLYAAACGLFWWAVRANRTQPLPACFSPNRKPHLTQTGPYGFVRHPFYCSYLLTSFAGVAATGRLWLLPTALIMLALYGVAARGEERDFANGPLAGEYQNYRRRTGRFFPNPWKLLVRVSNPTGSGPLLRKF